MIDILKIKADIAEITGRKSTKAEITCFLLGYAQGLNRLVGASAPAAAPAEKPAPPGQMTCPGCGKKTPKDAARCIHCGKTVK